MIYDDLLYGPGRVDESVLVALLQSSAMQRLHHVLQHGITGFLGLTQLIVRAFSRHHAGASLGWLFAGTDSGTAS